MARGGRLFSVAALVAALLVADGDDAERSDESRALRQARDRASHVAVWDAAHVYTTFLSCHDGRCAVTLAATGDGGRTWARRPLPLDTVGADGPDRRATNFRLSVLGPGILRLWWPVWQPGQAWWSTDAGVTWRSVPAALPVVRSVPPGWVPLERRAESPRIGAETPALPVGDPATGAAALLPVRSLSPFLSPAGAADRPLWSSGSRKYPNLLLVSDDRGASTRVVQPWADAPDLCPVAAVAPDGTVYAVTTRTPQGEPLLSRSADGGRSWESLAAAGLGFGRELFAVAAPPDGTLVVASEYLYDQRFHVSRDGGRTFTELAVRDFPREAFGFVPLPGGGYASTDVLDAFEVDSLAVSDDLRTWRTLTPPTR
ncbi:hypothetical protein AB0M43_12490 [Longispora sp. NPDC051575]|uniref:hypothetical protein n=1 Tax=Longispora sp. NPDC051575 TaxID=3154943 RepID=UPI003440110B